MESTESKGGIGFVGALAILFIALKLMGYIAWSWWWVLAPIWVPFAMALVCVIVAIVGTIALIAEWWKR